MNNFKIEVIENETKYSNAEIENAIRNDLLPGAIEIGYDEATYFNATIEVEGDNIRLSLETENGGNEKFLLVLIGEVEEIIFYCDEDTDSPIFSFREFDCWDSIIETIEFEDGNRQSRSLCMNGNSFFQLYQDTEWIDN